MVAKLMQLENAKQSITLTDEGIITEVNPLHWAKASTPIEITVLGIT